MHDVVVVGAGGSGIPLAVRLAEAGASVLLLESGDWPRGPGTPATRVAGASGGPHRREYRVELRPDRPWQLHRGRVMGGSTAVNGGYFIRARTRDFERWAVAGGAHWSPDAVLPLLRALESDQQFTDPSLHGVAGPMPVTRSPHHPLSEELTAAALALGIPADPDKNAQATPGVGPVPMNDRNGHRVSTAAGYLSGAPPAGLMVRTGIEALRVRISNGRALGVETTQGFVPAGEVVLSAGAIGSAHLLLLSGIGPAADLARWGLPVSADLPVGVGLADHPQVVLEASPPDPAHLPPDPASWLGVAVHLTSPGHPDPGNLELLQSLLPPSALVAGTDTGARSCLFISDLTPSRRGSLSLTSADPRVPPRVRLGHLASAPDRARLRHGVVIGRHLLGLPESDDAAVDRWVEQHLGTSVHTCATAPMGSVTDGEARVLGLSGLRVVDTSILPTAPARGPANTAVLIGELIGARMTRSR